MAVSQNYTKMMQDMMAAFPVDTSAFDDMFKNAAASSSKFVTIALQAADKSTEISTKWTRETIAKLGEVSVDNGDVAEYGQAMSDFASAQSELASQNMAAFADVAKQAQTDAAELVMAAGKDFGSEADAMMKTATDVKKPKAK